MSSNPPPQELVSGSNRPTPEDTATIECLSCGGSFERTDPRVFGAPVTYTCPTCETPIRLWMAGGQLQYDCESCK